MRNRNKENCALNPGFFPRQDKHSKRQLFNLFVMAKIPKYCSVDKAKHSPLSPLPLPTDASPQFVWKLTPLNYMWYQWRTLTETELVFSTPEIFRLGDNLEPKLFLQIFQGHLFGVNSKSHRLVLVELNMNGLLLLKVTLRMLRHFA